jgi:hypothetical protein
MKALIVEFFVVGTNVESFGCSGWMKDRNVRVAGTATSAKPCHVNALPEICCDWLMWFRQSFSNPLVAVWRNNTVYDSFCTNQTTAREDRRWYQAEQIRLRNMVAQISLTAPSCEQFMFTCTIQLGWKAHEVSMLNSHQTRSAWLNMENQTISQRYLSKNRLITLLKQLFGESNFKIQVSD